MSKEDLFKACLDHCDILRFEFILNKPCQNIDILLNETLERLQNRDLVHIPQVDLVPFSWREGGKITCRKFCTENFEILKWFFPLRFIIAETYSHLCHSTTTNRFCTQKIRSGPEDLH